MVAATAVISSAAFGFVMYNVGDGDASLSLYETCMAQAAIKSEVTNEFCQGLNEVFPDGWDHLLPCPNEINNITGEIVPKATLSYTLREYHDAFTQLELETANDYGDAAVDNILMKLCVDDASDRFKAQALRKRVSVMVKEEPVYGSTIKMLESDKWEETKKGSDIPMPPEDMVKIFNTGEVGVGSGRRLRGDEPVERRLLTNFEGICSASINMILWGEDTAECSGLSNNSTKCGTEETHCEAYCEDSEYYLTNTTLGMACLHHDACLQQNEQKMCNNGCAGCNEPYRNERLDYGDNQWNCDEMLRRDLLKCSKEWWYDDDDDDASACGGSDPFQARAVVMVMTDRNLPSLECEYRWVKWGWWGSYVPTCRTVWKWHHSPNYHFCKEV